MARISRFQLDTNKLNKLFSLFFEIVGKKNTNDEFQNTIHDLLSLTERIMIAKRIAIIYLLLKRIDQRTICESLHVSSATVAKFSLLMEKSTGIVPSFKTILQKEQISQFLEEVFLTLHPPGFSKSDWSSGQARKRNLERRKQTGF